MGAYKYIQETFESQYSNKSPEFKERLITWRRGPSVVRLDRPTNVASARSLGYKAKQGFVVARVRIARGSGMHSRPTKGRRPSRMGVNKLTRGKSKQSIAEERASRKFTNLEVLNSYWVMEDGQHKWFEVIMVDPSHPAVREDPDVQWIASGKHMKRVQRGKTSAGKKGRGLLHKGEGAEKIRPSIKGHDRKGK
ncbi:MAG: 50S ribosomal protein L15e [Candidatus Diapherotrites archaeon]|nr:50S ribosomal protein L15e [Candidatus Diapherotrites archaeon]